MKQVLFLPVTETYIRNSSAVIPMHKEAAGKHSVLPDFADGTTSRLSVADTAVQAHGARQLRQRIIDGVGRSSRRSGVGVDRLMLEETGVDTRQFRIQVTRHQHKTTRISEPSTGCTKHHTDPS